MPRISRTPFQNAQAALGSDIRGEPDRADRRSGCSWEGIVDTMLTLLDRAACRRRADRPDRRGQHPEPVRHRADARIGHLARHWHDARPAAALPVHRRSAAHRAGQRTWRASRSARCSAWLGSYIVFSLYGEVALPFDWKTNGIVLLVAAVAALLASVFPARRALKTAPVEALAEA
jgi:hypothetical protein